MIQPPTRYLDTDAAAGRIMAHARLLIKLTRRFEAVAPGGLRHAARVANYKAGKIVIHADNGAVAAKIRQMSQRLCLELSKGGTECSELEVKVQPRQPLQSSGISTQKPLSASTFGVLRSTADSLPSGPLKSALDRLIQRAAKVE